MGKLSCMLALGGLLAFNTCNAETATQEHKIRLSVRHKFNKSHDSSKTEAKVSSKTKIEKQQYELDIQVLNSSETEDTYTVEWYFIKRPITKEGKGEPSVCERGSTELTLPPRKPVKHPVTSKELSWKEGKTAAANSKTSAKVTISGDYYDGYIVLVTKNGEILAQESNEDKYLEPIWLAIARKR